MFFLLSLVVLLPSDRWTSAVSVSEPGNCSQPLGMEDGRILDSQITASSSYQETLVGPEQARLNSEESGGAWCPRRIIDLDHTLQEYLEIDFGGPTLVTSVILQGRYANGLGQEYTELYVIRYWVNGNWAEFSENGEKLIKGNNNTYQAVEHQIRPPFSTSKLRIYPFSYHPRTVCLRIELKGCRLYNDIDADNLTSSTSELQENHSVISTVQTESYFVTDEEWTETIFLAVAIGIMVVVILVTIAAITYVMASNWRLKYYTTFYTTSNIDTNSSIESSLKRGDELLQQADISNIYLKHNSLTNNIATNVTNTNNSYSDRGSNRSDNYVRMNYYPSSVKYVR